MPEKIKRFCLQSSNDKIRKRALEETVLHYLISTMENPTVSKVNDANPLVSKNFKALHSTLVFGFIASGSYICKNKVHKIKLVRATAHIHPKI